MRRHCPSPLTSSSPLCEPWYGPTSYALVVADMPFGSYEEGPTQALRTGVRYMKEGGAHAVKLEGGRRCAPQITALTSAGIPVMAHVGFTPQSEHTLGGYRVQGRGAAAEDVVADAHAVVEAGAFAVVLEMVPGDVAKRVTHEIAVPTWPAAGPETDAQVLVWQDMARYAFRTNAPLCQAVRRVGRRPGERRPVGYADEVRAGTFPAAAHTF